MKKKVLLLLAVTALWTLVLAVCGYSFISNVYENERNTVKQIAGSVIAAYPEAEMVLMSSLERKDIEAIALGEALMIPYGYHDVHSFWDAPRYESSLHQMIGLLSLVFLLTSAIGCFGLWYVTKRRSDQEHQILYLLDCCLTGDFPDEDDFAKLGNDHFTHTIRKLSHKLQKKTEWLEGEHDATKTLVTDISHQLKTPISALKSCFAMAMESSSPEEKESFLMRCGMQIDKLESLSAALIQISRLESNMVTLQPEWVSLADLLVAAVNTVYLKAAEKDMEIVTAEFSDETLFLDKKWMSEAIANLLDNAIKYSPSHSPIHLRVQKRQSFLRIEVEDHGIGIPNVEKNQIFQRFYRGSHEIVKNQDGSGVGLYLSRRIVEDSGGTLSVFSSEEGSRFVLQLPLSVREM